MLYATDIDNIETHNDLDLFWSVIFDKGEKFSKINSAKCEVATLLHIPAYLSINKHPLIMKYIKYTIGIFHLNHHN